MATKSNPKTAKTAGWSAVFERPGFAKKYAVFSVLVLLATALFWSIKSAGLQQSNADQLVDPHLFENSHTLQQALLPSAHTFLLKWPLFWLIKLFNYSEIAFVTVTVLSVLLTLAGLVWLLYKIERRPLILGTICLALASVLLLVPAQPYAGSLLPVNMAMLATRNLEYLLYVASLVLFIKSPRLKSAGFWLAVICLGLLVASDRLFLFISAGGAVLAMLAYALTRGWKLTALAARWLVTSGLAAVLAAALIWLIQASKLTAVSSGSAAGPYGSVKNAHDLALGIIYAVSGLLTNFGANPAYDATIVKNIPHELITRLSSLGGPAYIVNALVLATALFMSGTIVWTSLTHHRKSTTKLNKMNGDSILTVMLIWSALAAIIVFVATDHYFAVDARYLGIVLFALFVAAATFTSRRAWQASKVVLVGAGLLLSVVFGVFYANTIDHGERLALDQVNQRNGLIAQAVDRRNTKVLVGDYWRVLPVKQAGRSNLTIMPLVNCNQPRSSLSSKAWQPNLNNHAFAYLLTLDGSLTGYSHCTINQILVAYGRPNASTVIAGSLSKPKELLLFYDHGAHKSSPTNKALPQGPSTVVPVSLPQLLGLLPGLQCQGPTIMNIVAHQDDDLLFMNPDLLHSISAGYCIRTVYVTAGDAGSNKFYWLGREQGSEAAYSAMTPQTDNLWVQRLVQLSKNEYVTVSSPLGNPNIAIVFMHLPDGNLWGEGFKASNYESLQKLEIGKINAIKSVDGQSSYNSSQLVDALTSLMQLFQPTEIRTQANYISHRYPDHSDHMAVGRYVKKAYAQYEKEHFENSIIVPFKFYIGYPVHEFPPNVSGTDLRQSNAAYFAYARFDKSACQTEKDCESKSTFGLYLERQYQNPY